VDRAELQLLERSVSHAVANNTGAALDAALDQLGWRDAFEADQRAAVSILFGRQGAANATSSAIDAVLARACGTSAPAVVLPALGEWCPPAALDAQHATISGMGTGAIAINETVLVVARSEDKDVGSVVATTELALRPVHGIDPWLGLVEVHGDVEVGDQRSVDWTAAVALGQLALGHELVGVGRTMLDLAREHALERIQFGRPISTFQAVRHRLAEALVALETADAVLAAAWDDRSPETAAMGKALAGRAQHTVARHCQQVLAGIGFTTEHVLHRYVRRGLVLDQLLGSARSLTRQLGRDVLDTRRLPAVQPL
jgi:hypothetical protein